MPGSRTQEIKTLAPLFLKAFKTSPLTSHYQPVWLTPSHQYALLKKSYTRWDQTPYIETQNHSAWHAHADLALVASGTATLEPLHWQNAPWWLRIRCLVFLAGYCARL